MSKSRTRKHPRPVEPSPSLEVLDAPKWRDLHALLLLLGTWLVFWWPEVIEHQLLYMRDLTFYALPMKTYLLERLLSGQFPFWTPHLSAGMPFFAEASHQALYPFNLLLFLTPSVVEAIHWSSLLHTLLGLGAFYALARSLKLSPALAMWSTLLYGFSGYILSITDNVNYQPATVWCPLGFFALIRALETRNLGYVALLSLCVALLIFAGDSFNTLFFAMYCGLLVLLRWRMSDLFPGAGRWASIGYLALGFGLGGMISAVQLLPEKELLDFSVRQVPLDFHEVTLWSLPPQRLIEFIHPFFYGSKYPNPHFIGMFLYPEFREPWADSIYLGLIPLLFAAWGACRQWRKSLFWSLMLVTGLLLAFGHYAFYYPALLKIFPPLHYQRYLEKFVLWATLALPLLAGIGVQEFLKAQPQTLFRWFSGSLQRKALVSLGILGLSTYLFLQVPAQLWIWPHAMERSMEWGPHFYNRELHMQGLLTHWIGLGTLVLAFFCIPPAYQKRYTLILLCIAVVDLMAVHWNHTPTAPPSLLIHRPTPSALQVIQADHPPMPYRIFYDDGVEYQETLQNPVLLKRIANAYGMPTLSDSYHQYWVYRVLYNQERLLFNYGIRHQQNYLNGRYAPLQPLYHHQMDQVLTSYYPALLMALSSVNYIITSLTPYNPAWDLPNYQEIGRDPDLNLRVLRFKNPLPRAYVVPNALYNTNPEIYRLVTPAFKNFKSQVELDALPPFGREESSTTPLQPLLPTPLQIHEVSPEQYEAEVDSPYPYAYLVLTEGFFPGWQGWVDGQPAPVIRANHRFMAIPFSRGKHRVSFRYHSIYFETGLWLSVWGLILGLGLFCIAPAQRFVKRRLLKG